MRRYAGHIHWRLLLSYLLVALVCGLTLEMLTLSVFFARPQTATPVSRLVDPRAVEALLAPQIAPYLAQKPPDQRALSGWSRNFVYRTGNYFQPHSQLWLQLGNVSSVSLVQIQDRSGLILTSVAASKVPVRKLLNYAQSHAVTREARENEPDDLRAADQLAQVLPDGETVLAVPVHTYDNQFLGTLFAVLSKTVTSPPQVHSPIAQLTPLFLLPSALIGLLAGLLLPAGLMRRSGYQKEK